MKADTAAVVERRGVGREKKVTHSSADTMDACETVGGEGATQGFLTGGSWCSTACRCGILHSAEGQTR